MQVDEEGIPHFPPTEDQSTAHIVEVRKVRIPPYQMSRLKASWPKIYPPLVEHLKLQTRVNLKSKIVEIRSSKLTTNSGALQKGEDFVRAFCLGFDVDDVIALLRLDDLFIETFEIKDVKTLNGEHLGRAIGRIAGKDGKTKFAIENASRTRVVLADSKIHILGGFKNIHMARESIVSLILGSPPVGFTLTIALAVLMLVLGIGQSIRQSPESCVTNEGAVLNIGGKKSKARNLAGRVAMNILIPLSLHICKRKGTSSMYSTADPNIDALQARLYSEIGNRKSSV